MSLTDRASLSPVYRERAALVAHLDRVYPSCWWAQDPAWPCIYLDTPAGQISWHIALEDTDLFDDMVYATEDPWDGHDTAEKYRRLGELPTFR